MTRVLIVLGIVGAGFLANAGAATYLVMPGGIGEYPTIQSAMDAASYGDTVLVMPGTYYDCTHPDNHGRFCSVFMKSGVCLQGQTGQPADVTIDAQHNGRAIFCEYADGSTIIRGLTLTGAWVEGTDLGRWGGGLCCVYSTPLIENVVFTGNHASSGGGMACRYSSPTIRGCSFIGNDAISDGGGLYVLSESEPLIENCLFTGNEVEMDGGAIYFTHSSGIVRDCLFTHNLAGFWGAGIYCQSNSAPEIRNCTLCLNHCYGDGSGICASSGSTPTVDRCIVAFNTGAPGISTLAGADASTISVLCSDVYGQPDDNYGGTTPDQTGLNDNISADPCFCDLAADAFTLWNYSPCAQAGCGTIGAYPVACWAAQDVAGPGATSAREGRLAVSASPNPFSATTSILFTSPVPGSPQIAILDMAGREVRSLAVTGTARGSSTSTWDGRDGDGQRVPVGVYWVRALYEGGGVSARVVVLR